MKKWVPDYVNAYDLTLNSSGGCTVTEDGWVRYYYYGYTVGNIHSVSILVNGFTVFNQTQEAPAPNQARALRGMTIFQVKAGDIVTQSGSGEERAAKFIPGKWV